MDIEKRIVTGEQLNEMYKVGAVQSHYHIDGTWYKNLTLFPGALFDADGYIKFETEEDYFGCEKLKIKEETNVYEGIRSIPGYKWYPEPIVVKLYYTSFESKSHEEQLKEIEILKSKIKHRK